MANAGRGEVSHVGVFDRALQLHKRTKKVIINRLAYADREEAARLIAAQAPEGPPPQGRP